MKSIAQDVTPTARQKPEQGEGISSQAAVDVPYEAGHSGHVPHALESTLWGFLHRPETVISLRTATAMGRPAVEGISESLVHEFGREISEQTIKQVLGRMVKLRMEALGYEVHKPRARTKSGIFSTGIVFRPAVHSRPDLFNLWLDQQVRSPDGKIDPDRLAQVAHARGVKFSLKSWNVKIRRLELGALLRPVVPKAEYETAEAYADDEDVRRGSHESGHRQFPGVPDDKAEVEAGIQRISRRRRMIV